MCVLDRGSKETLHVYSSDTHIMHGAKYCRRLMINKDSWADDPLYIVCGYYVTKTDLRRVHGSVVIDIVSDS